jgi:L-ascorbate metabolism protein UlaG (beta-lactamase superfamily)
MQLTHFGHSCLLAEFDHTRLLFDPGTFAHGFEGITGLSAILITHQHPDHVDVARLPALLEGNPMPHCTPIRKPPPRWARRAGRCTSATSCRSGS